ncbi:MAG: alpha/beta hydrolase [Balneolaceae bacterium]
MTGSVTFRNNINRFGKGAQTIMFAHGYGCDQNMWRFITPAFEKDFDIILFDHIGSGKSDISAYDFSKYNSLKGYAEDVITICEDLNLKNVIFVGHSVSSMIGVLSAVKRADLFSRLIMICPSPRYIKDENYEGFSKQDIDGMLEMLENNYLGWSSSITPVIAGNDQAASDELKNSFCRMNPKIAKHFAKVTFLGDHREDLAKVSTPTLIIQCDPDGIAPVQVGKYVHSQMQNSQFSHFNVPGHSPHLTAPGQTTKAISSYLNL